VNSCPDSKDPILSFGRYARGTSEVFCPRTLDDVKEVFALAKQRQRNVTIRGGGHSFDGQAVQDRDTGQQIVLKTDAFDRIEFAEDGRSVTLGAGVPWRRFVAAALHRARERGEPIRLPGSMQTGGEATAGGTLAGDCLSRFSATMGKESRWIVSFTLLTTGGRLLEVSATADPTLFNAVVGGLGYIGFVSDITYRLVDIPGDSCAHTTITTFENLRDLIAEQVALIERANPESMLAISSAAFADLIEPNPKRVKGAVFQSTYRAPGTPRRSRFPLYDDIDSPGRHVAELLARTEPANWAIHTYLFELARLGREFENDLTDFIFFMDGNTFAKRAFEKEHPKQLFPIVQQTWVIPAEHAVDFAQQCVDRTRLLRPTEFDLLFVPADDCLMSANFGMSGFAVTLGFEPLTQPGSEPPDDVRHLLMDLSREALKVKGRIHLVKNVCAEPEVFHDMFSPQIDAFEKIKRDYDPDLILQNRFSRTFFRF
jgi:decaprenylphospho-beta-D-ribofuranose 2-oxidase